MISSASTGMLTRLDTESSDPPDPSPLQLNRKALKIRNPKKYKLRCDTIKQISHLWALKTNIPYSKRSEERRVGREYRSRRWPDSNNKEKSEQEEQADRARIIVSM